MRTNLIVLVLAAAPAAALASGDSVPNVNPRDLGLSGSGVAAQRDAAAVYANPAALARLDEGLRVSAAISALDIASTWHAPAGPAEADTRFKLAPPGGAFVSYGTTLRGNRVGFGAGFNVPFGGNVFWDDGWQGRFHVVSVDRRVYAGYLNAAMAAGPRLRLAGGLVYYYTTEYLEQGMDFLGSEGYAEVSTHGGAPAFQVAAELDMTENVRVGFDYKHKAHQKLEGEAAFHGVPDSLRPSLPDQDVDHPFVLPNVVDLAVAWQATQDLLVTAAVTLDRYQVYEEDRFTGSAGTEVLVVRDYRNGWTYRAGVEYRLRPTVELRAGVLRDVSGVRPERFSPSLPDASAWAGSVGGSWFLRPNMSLDAGLFVALFDRLNATYSYFDGKYDTRAEIFSVGFTWRPAAR